jgi:hypothetical protein
VPSLATSFHVVTCPDDFYAVRMGFANISRCPYEIARAIASPSAEPGDFANPVPDGQWVPFTFAHGGADIDHVVASPEAPTKIVVAGTPPRSAICEVPIPQWTWTDWVPVASRPRRDAPGAPRLLMVRLLVPGDSRITQPNGGFEGYFASPAVNHGFEHGAGWIPYDFVTEPDVPVGNLAAASFGIARSTVACVQFATSNRGIVGMAVGDSHHQGTSTSTQFMNFLLRSVTQIGAAYVGRIPFGYVSAAVGGAKSD